MVTGGTRGIGGAISKALKAAGYQVAATYHGNDEAAAKFKAETGVQTYKWDVGSFEACSGGLAQVAKDLGPVDVLVNNAGITKDGNVPQNDPGTVKGQTLRSGACPGKPPEPAKSYEASADA